MIGLKLKEEGVKILTALAESELYQQNFFMYASLCCSNYGYYYARDWFYEKSKEEQSHFNRLSEFLQTRGVKSDVPKVDAPELEFTDLRSAIKAAYELEIEVTEEYAKATRKMFDIDLLAYHELMSFICDQKWAIERYQKLMTIFEGIEGKEDQMELERVHMNINPLPEVTQG